MKSIDDIQKLQAVVCYVLGKSQGGMDYIHLFKSMYFAQQEHLVEYGLPIFNDTFLVRKHGPVPALTYKVIRCVEGRNTEPVIDLDEFIQSLVVSEVDGLKVVSLREGVSYDEDELSVSNMKVLDRCVDRCMAVESFELSNISHQDTAFKKAARKSRETGEDTYIPLYDIAKAGGAKDTTLRVIRERQINMRESSWI